MHYVLIVCIEVYNFKQENLNFTRKLFINIKHNIY